MSGTTFVGDYVELVERLNAHREPWGIHHDLREVDVCLEAATAIAALVAENERFKRAHERHLVLGAEVRTRAEAAEAQVKAMDEALGPVESKSERYADKERNKIINLASGELENVINGHDPDMSILDNDVWDHLDRLCCAIEAHVARRARAVKGGA